MSLIKLSKNDIKKICAKHGLKNGDEYIKADYIQKWNGMMI